MLRYRFEPELPSTAFYDAVNPIKVWTPFTDMVKTMAREDYGFKFTSIGDQFVDMYGADQRSPLWDFDRFTRPASSSNANKISLRGFCNPGHILHEEYVKLFDLKVGLAKRSPPNDDMMRGIIWEDPIADKFAEDYNMVLGEAPMIPHGVSVKENIVYKQPNRVEALGVSCDRIILHSENPEDDRGLVEIKCPRKIDRNKFVSYLDQINFQMWALDATHCYLVQGIPDEISDTGKWQMHVERVPRDPNWAYYNVGNLLGFVNDVYNYRETNQISYSKYLSLTA